MYSCNLSVPPRVARLASGLAADLRTANARQRHSIVVKRLGDDPLPQVAARVRETVAGTAPFAARVTGVGLFERPPSGAAPVVYLTVESPGLDALHERLCEAFEPVEGLEGDGYTPHVTIARGGDAGRLVGREVQPVEWEVDRLELWDDHYRETPETISLPA